MQISKSDTDMSAICLYLQTQINLSKDEGRFQEHTASFKIHVSVIY